MGQAVHKYEWLFIIITGCYCSFPTKSFSLKKQYHMVNSWRTDLGRIWGNPEERLALSIISKWDQLTYTEASA